MKTIRLAIAAPIGWQIPQPVTIVIDAGVPDFADLPAAEAWYEQQAGLLTEALFNALPQGTLDRLHLHLMARKLSLYKGVTEG